MTLYVQVLDASSCVVMAMIFVGLEGIVTISAIVSDAIYVQPVYIIHMQYIQSFNQALVLAALHLTTRARSRLV